MEGNYEAYKNKRGQSTVEYVLLVTAVLAVIIAFVSTKNGGFQGQMNTTLNDTVTGQVGELWSDQGLAGSYDGQAPYAMAVPSFVFGTRLLRLKGTS